MILKYFTVHDAAFCIFYSAWYRNLFPIELSWPWKKGEGGRRGGEGKVEGRWEGGGGCPALLVRGYGRKIRQKINTVLIFIFWGILQWPLFVSTYVSYIHF